jgi:hypothetical protein
MYEYEVYISYFETTHTNSKRILLLYKIPTSGLGDLFTNLSKIKQPAHDTVQDQLTVHNPVRIQATCSQPCLDPGYVFTTLSGSRLRVHNAVRIQATCSQRCPDPGYVFTTLLTSLSVTKPPVYNADGDKA